jgi:hypothetical protein
LAISLRGHPLPATSNVLALSLPQGLADSKPQVFHVICSSSQTRLRAHSWICLLPSSHLFVGTDCLPVLFKVSHGREILVRPQHPGPALVSGWRRTCWTTKRGAENGAPWESGTLISLLGMPVLPRKRCYLWTFYFQLNFIGVTVKLEQKYVHFTSTSHQFIPVPIGDTLPPRQVSMGLYSLNCQEAYVLISSVFDRVIKTLLSRIT